MGLKSFIEKIIVVNKNYGHVNNVKRLLYREYLPENDFKNLEELKKIFNNLEEHAQNEELKLGLKIILTLISHKNTNITIFALEKIYFLVDDEYIEGIIVKELKNMSYNKNKDIHIAAQRSLDSIASEVNKLRTFEIIFGILSKLKCKINFKVDKSLFSLIHRSKFFSKNTSEIRKIVCSSNLINRILRMVRVFSRLIDRIFPYVEEIESNHYEKLIEHEMIPYYHVLKLEFKREESLQGLANFYVRTFREKGHLRRLIALLDDDDGNVQQIGVNALIDVVKVLLTGFDQEVYRV